MLIHLHAGRTCRGHHSVDRQKDAHLPLYAADEHENQDGSKKPSQTCKPVVNFDPVQEYIQELKVCQVLINV